MSYKHYVELIPGTNLIQTGWSSGEQPRRKTDNAICVLEDESREFHLTPDGEVHPIIRQEQDIPLYRYVDGQVTALDTAEVETLVRKGQEAYEAAHQIAELNKKLADTDYIDNKIVELGESMREKYAEKIAQRQTWRDEINRLQKIVNGRYDI